MKWAKLCIYTLLPCVQSSFQIIICLWGKNKNKYTSEVVNAIGSYCGSKVDPESSVWLRVACCNLLSHDLSQLPHEPFQRYLPGTDLQLQTLIFSFIKFTLVTVKIEVGYTPLKIHDRIRVYLIRNNAFVLAWEWNSVPVTRKWSPKKQVIPAEPAVKYTNGYKNYFRSPRRVGTYRENCV